MKALVLFLACTLALSAFRGSAAAEVRIERSQRTARHLIALTIGPVTAMLTPREALEAHQGELMLRLAVQSDEGAAPVMAVADAGQPVNHQVAVRLYDAATGDLLLEPVPRVTIRNEDSGTVQRLAPVVAMQDLRLGPRDYHFGNNVYLPDGRYTVTVVLEDETAAFPHFLLKAMDTMF